MSNKTVESTSGGKYSNVLKNAPEGNEVNEDKAPAIKAIADFSADGEIVIRGQFTPENIRFTKKSSAPYVSIAFEDSYPLRSGTATVYLASTFTKEVNE